MKPDPTPPTIEPGSPLEVVFWTGAGVSADLPTGAPLGRTLTDRALSNYFEPDTLARLARLYADLNAPNAHFRPRLETVLDCLAEVYGLAGLADVLSDLMNAEPNRHHAALHSLADAGSRIITANFDTCTQRAGPSAIEVVHFHGAIGGQHDIARLGARLSVIEDGFPEAVIEDLRKTLERAPISRLVFLGYSGSDFFDATPFLRSWLRASPPVQVIWHIYSSGPLKFEWFVPNAAMDLPAQIATLGHEVIVAYGTLDDLIPSLVRSRLSVPVVGRQNPALPRARWAPSLHRSEQERLTATGSIFIRLGYRAGVLDHFAKTSPRTRAEWLGLADACWGSGQYRRALNAWMHGYSEDSSDDFWRRLERRGAFLWITGRLLSAERLLWRAVVENAEDRSCSPAVRAALVRTYGRVYVHMRRNPDTRLMTSSRRSERVLEGARQLLRDHMTELTSEDRVELQNVVAALGNASDAAFPRHVAEFQEREHISAWLNYSHGSLRDRYYHASADSRPTAAEYREQARREEVLGAVADRMRAMLIPGAPRHFTLREFVTAIRQVEMSCWNRVRFVLGFGVLRTRAIVTRRSTT